MQKLNKYMWLFIAGIVAEPLYSKNVEFRPFFHLTLIFLALLVGLIFFP